MKIFTKSLTLLALLAAGAGFSGTLNAQTLTWTVATGTGQNGTGIWNTTNSNWISSGSNYVWTNGDSAVIGVKAAGGNTLTLGTAISVANLTFPDPGGTGGANVINGGGNTLTITGTLSANDGYGTTINANTNFSNGLVYIGPGAITIAGTSTITNGITQSSNLLNLSGTLVEAGTVTITGGELKLSAGPTQINQLTGNITINGGSLDASGTITNVVGNTAGQLQITGGVSGFAGNGTGANALTVNLNVGGVAGGTLTWGSAYFSPTTLIMDNAIDKGTLTFLNGIDLAGNTTRAINDAANGTSTVIMAGNIMNSSGTGGLTFNYSNNGNAGQTVLYVLSGSNSYLGTTTFSGAGGRYVLGTGSAAAYLSSTNIVLNNTQTQFGINITGTTTITAPISSLVMNTSGLANDPNQTVIIGGSTGGFAVGTGTVIFTGSSSYSGGTLIKSGVLQIGNGGASGSLPAASVVSGSNGAILAYDRSDSVTLNSTISGVLGLSQIGSGMLTLAGSGITYTGATTVSSGTLQVGSGTVDAPMNSSSLTNNGAVIFNTIGSQTFAGAITGIGSIQKTGTGTQTLSGSNNYFGATTVTSGTLGIGNAFALGNTSLLSVSGSGALNFLTTSAKTITLTGTSGITLSLSNGALLNFGVGNGSDLLQLSGSAHASVTGTIGISLGVLSGNAGTYNLLSAPGGGLLTGGTFNLLNNAGFTSAVLNETDNLISVTVSSIGPVIFWKGTTSNSWQTLGNFTTDATGTSTLTSSYSSGQDVVFSASGATRQNTILGGDVGIKSLTINDTAAVTVGGTNTLSIAGSSGTTGITVHNGAGVAVISSNVTFTGTSTVEVDSANGLTISGTIGGSQGLTKNGNGQLVITGSNTYSGGTVINAGTLNINSDSNLGALSGNVTFSGSGATLQLAPSLSGTLTSNRSLVVSSGTGSLDTNGNTMLITGSIAGSGVFNKAGLGQLIETSSISTPVVVSSGTLTLTTPTWLGSAATASFNIAAGATLSVTSTAAQIDLEPTFAVQILGNGTFLNSGTGDLQMHKNGVQFNMTGGVIELGAGLTENGGPGGQTSITWTNNLASLQVDAGATYNTWDGNTTIVDALLGSGTITRLGYGSAANQITIGQNNGSGTFSGVITNALGWNNIVKTGTGTQVFSGSNSYAGTTAVNNGTLRITNNDGLGFGGPTYNTTLGSVTVTGTGSTLDLAGVTVNKVIVLAGANLLNSNTSTQTVIDNGIAQLELTTAAGYSGAPSLSFTPNDATGSGVSGSGSIWVSGGKNDGGNGQLYVYLTSPGTGYTVAPSVTITDATGVGATATAVISAVQLSGTANSIGGQGDMTVNAVVSGAAAGFTKVGNGTLTLTANNTYTGPTNVAAGTFHLAATGSISGSTSVSNGAKAIIDGVTTGNVKLAGILDGTGTISGAVGVTVQPTGVVSPSTVSTTQNLNVTNGNVDFSLGGTLQITLNSSQLANPSSFLSVSSTATGTGIMNLSTGLAHLTGVDLNTGATSFTQNVTSFSVVYAANGFNGGTFSGLPGGTGSDIQIGNYFYQVDYVGDGGTGTYLQLTYIPEPQTWAMLVGGFGILVGLMRRRHSRF